MMMIKFLTQGQVILIKLHKVKNQWSNPHQENKGHTIRPTRLKSTSKIMVMIRGYVTFSSSQG